MKLQRFFLPDGASETDHFGIIMRVVEADDSANLKIILDTSGNQFETIIAASIKQFRARKCLRLILSMEPRISILSPADSKPMVLWLLRNGLVPTQGEYNIHVPPTPQQLQLAPLSMVGRWLTSYLKKYS